MTDAAGSLVAFAVAVSFAAGLNTYATVATLGLLARWHWVALPAGLAPLGETWVVVAALVLFGLEFVADKVPFVDLIWNFAHTLVRVPVAGLLAWRATSELSPGLQAMVVLVAAGISLVAHGGKTAARTAVTASPEPVSNVALSAGEDVLSIALTWMATKHPIAAAAATGAMVIGIGLGIRLALRGLRIGWRRIAGSLQG